MNWFFAGGIPPWAWVEIAGLTILGALGGGKLGYRLGRRHVRAQLRARAEERRAGRWLAGVRETRGGTVMPPDRTALVQTPPEIAHEWPAQEPVLYGRRRPRDAREDPGLIDKVLAAAPAAPAAVEWDAHVAQAIALTETDEEFTARLAGWADDIIAAARTAADPYWDGP